jgi:hypothetical protein|tara:strand:- start:349 stop:564 length:216 start_codon:yes stop_codon:yes gene_type:complete
MSNEEFIFVPEGEQHVVVPINESDGKQLQDIANGYRSAIEWNLQSHDGTNIILYFINEKDLEADETIKYDG